MTEKRIKVTATVSKAFHQQTHRGIVMCLSCLQNWMSVKQLYVSGVFRGCRLQITTDYHMACAPLRSRTKFGQDLACKRMYKNDVGPCTHIVYTLALK